MNILDKINSPADLRELTNEELTCLAEEIRTFLIDTVSDTGGHLASNLGAVELTMAIHRVYDTSRDRIVFDVGHQSYVHKILTGRRDKFNTLRKFGGLSGFPKPSESSHDAFVAGHASNSVSVALGMAKARSLKNEDYAVAAVIGDGALSGGLAYEGLSNAGASGEGMVVILNDNEMSISPNVGGISLMLSRLRVRSGYLRFKRSYRHAMRRMPGLYAFIHRMKEGVKHFLLPGNTFSDMGFYYLGPVDGHDLRQLEDALIMAREMECPVLLHVKTVKGKGYAPAEDDPSAYHGVGTFDPEEGVKKGGRGFSNVFGDEMCVLARKHPELVGITAAMCYGTGLRPFSKEFPERLFDVGIAEGHAVSMAAGLAKQGACPVFAVYSSFLQRSYDMLIHDVSLLGLHVVLGVDRAGLVGADGETHHGVFDVSFLRSVPYMTVLCPASYAEMRAMLDLAVERITTPVAIRYPRGGEGRYTSDTSNRMVSVLGDSRDAAIVVYGTMINQALEATDILHTRGLDARVVKINVINPLDLDLVVSACAPCRAVVVAEEVCAAGCVGLDILSRRRAGVRLLNLGSGIAPHGGTQELLHSFSLDGEGIANAVIQELGEDING
ncbi:MAG: 1-deoxy-D-xylulose-5-phosphate synthase [Candidatus Heteroscillospira sp.]